MLSCALNSSKSLVIRLTKRTLHSYETQLRVPAKHVSNGVRATWYRRGKGDNKLLLSKPLLSLEITHDF
jgi:hypothetical protein